MSENIKIGHMTPTQERIQEELGVKFQTTKDYGAAAHGYCPLVNGEIKGFFTTYEAAKKNRGSGIIISASDAHKYKIPKKLIVA